MPRRNPIALPSRARGSLRFSFSRGVGVYPRRASPLTKGGLRGVGCHWRLVRRFLRHWTLGFFLLWTASARAGLPPTTCELQKLTASDKAPDDLFGVSVSHFGDRTIVGAHLDDCPAGIDCGSAYVYRYDGTTWVHEQKLTACDAAESDAFGVSVSLSGYRAIVGAYHDDCSAGSHCGSAYVYRYNGTTWVQEQRLAASDAAQDDWFAYSVSLSGDRAIVGADGDDCPVGYNCGSAYVYRHDGAVWVQEQKLTASDAAAYDHFGRSVFLSGDRAIVGAYEDDCAAGTPACGSAYVYHYVGTTWVQEQKLTASDAEWRDHFGISVSLSADTAIVGASWDNCPAGILCGSAYVYRYNGTTWVQEQKLTASDEAEFDRFGVSVSVSGDMAIVGADADRCPAGGLYCGSVSIYRYDGTTWIEDRKLTASDAGRSAQFGVSVSLSGDKALVGAFADDCPAGSNCGAAYVFALDSPDCQPNGVPDACDIRDGRSPDDDGNAVPDECESGACCDGTSGICAGDVSMVLCTGDQRSWRVNTLCAELDPTCTQHTGACCELLTGACTDEILPGACSGEQQRWTKDTTCIAAGCEAVTGACCDPDPFGGCTDGLTLAECTCDGCEWTKLASCDDVTCTPSQPIPTVSAWGLTILSLLLLTGAKIRFGRFPRDGRSEVGTNRLA